MGELSQLIDVHHHIIPKAYVENLTKKGVKKSLGMSFPNWKPAKTIELMDRNGIAASVISISAPGVYFPEMDAPTEFAINLSRETNDICAGLIHDHPGRFGAFATLPLPDVDAAMKEISYALDTLKLDGIVLLSNYDGYYLGDPRFDGLFSELDRRKAVVFIHPATPPGIEQSHFGFPDALMDVCFDTTRTAFSLMLNGTLRRYPNVRFILAHAGGAVPYMAARANMIVSIFTNTGGATPIVAGGAGIATAILPQLKQLLPESLDIYLKIKKNVPEGPDYYLKRFYYDTALSASPHALASLQTIADASHIVFGTDYIFATPAAIPITIKSLGEYAGFSPEDLRSIGRENSKALFPRLSNDPEDRKC